MSKILRMGDVQIPKENIAIVQETIKLENINISSKSDGGVYYRTLTSIEKTGYSLLSVNLSSWLTCSGLFNVVLLRNNDIEFIANSPVTIGTVYLKVTYIRN